MSGGVALFGGTTEGRKIAELLAGTAVPMDVYVATAYGAGLLPISLNITVHTGRLGRAELGAELQKVSPALVVDATHPYAAVITGNLEELCESLDLSYMRIRRAASSTRTGRALIVSSMEEGADFLDGTEGNILVTTGSKELAALTRIRKFTERCYARVLPMVSSIEKCNAAGIPASHILALQGPFSVDMNRTLMRDHDIAWLLTKDSGEEGGCPEKLKAADLEGAGVVLIGRPEESDEAISLERAMNIICEEWGIADKQAADFAENRSESVKKNADSESYEDGGTPGERQLALIGIGPGKTGLLTRDAEAFLAGTDLLVGASRMVEAGETIRKESGAVKKAVSCAAIRPRDIVLELTGREWTRAAVLYSGDISLYSGAKALRAELEKAKKKGLLEDAEIRTYNGISSAAYFLGKIGVSAEDVCITSLHGREGSLLPLVRTHRRVLSLLGTGNETRELASALLKYGLIDVRLTVGERLSYPDERIAEGYPADFTEKITEKLALLYVENPHAENVMSGFGLPDDVFIRGNVPMTKREIRTIALSRMDIQSDSVVWDVGAGTGSVSIEAALHAPGGMVYAVERKAEAVSLIRENAKKFFCDNIHVFEGEAPEALLGLPAPDAVFVGGSGGNLREILDCIYDKNIDARVVITAVTSETAAELGALRKTLPDGKVMEQTEILAIREKEAGNYHLRRAENPVVIAVIRDE